MTMSSEEFHSFDLSASDEDFELPVELTKRKKQAERRSLPPKRPRRIYPLSATLNKASSPVLSMPETSQEEQSSQDRSWKPLPRTGRRALNSGDKAVSPKDIYDSVSSGKSDLLTVVEDWLDYYKKGREQGLLVLINFIVRCCGCQGVVSREMLDSMENAEIIATLTKQLNQESARYPLSRTGSSLKRFRSGLCEFAHMLVRCCRSFIYDDYLFPSLFSLLTGLSDSQVRAFRHTSTLIAIKLMSGLVEVVVAVSLQLQTVQWRYRLEEGKSKEAQDSERLEDLKGTISELLENKEELSSMMNATFRGIFVHRYRDRVVAIRAACIEELGVWIRTDPEGFLNDGCIKYLGWMLNDKESVVRLQCVRILRLLYQEKGFIGRLELFTSRFKKRILNMVMDKDYEVAVEVVKLLLQIHQSVEEGLQEEECAQIYSLVYTTNRSLACAAGLFLYTRLKSMISSDNEKDINSEFIQILISFHIQSGLHEQGIYLVDSLWDAVDSELKDWECMTTLLLQDTGLVNKEEDALIELMVCAIRRAADPTPPIGRVHVKKGLNVKQKKTQEHSRRRITAHFIPLLTQLLAKYSADARKVHFLLQVPLYFDLDMYSSAQRMEKHLDQLLAQICWIVEKHTDKAVLEKCSKLINVLCSDSHTFSSRSYRAFSQLFDSLTECFNTGLSELMQGPADDDDFNAAMTLKRIAALVSGKNLSTGRLFYSCMDLLKTRLESRHLDEELVVAALRCCALHLMWAKVTVPSLPSQDEVNHLKKQACSFCKICQVCLSLGQAEIRDQAFDFLCDLLMIYSPKAVISEPALQNLYHRPSDSLRAEMAGFLLDYVFSDTDDMELEDQEEEIKLRQKKRNQLASFCKLVIYGVIDLTAATDVFKYYDKCFQDFGDIIKETIMKTKLINPVLSARTLCLTIQQLYTEMLTEVVSKKNIDEIRHLARKLALTFGNNLVNACKPLVYLHMDGIRFAFRAPQEGEEQYPNVAFLEILSEFSFKLLQQDKTHLAGFLKSQCPSALLSWQSVSVYWRSLEGTAAKLRDKAEAVSPQAIPVVKHQKTTTRGSHATSRKESRLDSSSIHGGLPTPTLTSTAQKQPRIVACTSDVLLESDIGSDSTELESEDEFSSGSQMPDLILTKRSNSTEDDKEPSTSLLPPMEECDVEQEEPMSDEAESDSSSVPPSTQHRSVFELFN
ncbi:cohesin subunit SA-1-like isoform X1 [Syngnathoides biaculeatus]|uniref:cohesin subunit SA-1-like isoform X1 n=1 Tax=Syngnathoides biaculeatus TaxID=300417 RepID=UPI002ADDE8D6|nr:cohesin subunit SA-1-like isoform X1 [Syngnathoides biaculeatus]